MFDSLKYETRHYILEEVLSLFSDYLNKTDSIESTIGQLLLLKSYKNIKNISKLKTHLNQIAKEHIQNHKPLSKIFQRKYFYNNFFKVTEDTLCPRQETEILIDRIRDIKPTPKTILDLGTGSGALAITLKNLFPKTHVFAIDICTKALEVAKENSINQNTKINFIKNNWLDGWQQKIDVLISNPPYLESEEITKELSYDPVLSLTHNDVFWFYEEIKKKQHLFKHIFLEINPKHTTNLSKVFPGAVVVKDYNDDDRFLYMRNCPPGGA